MNVPLTPAERERRRAAFVAYLAGAEPAIDRFAALDHIAFGPRSGAATEPATPRYNPYEETP